MNLNLLIGWSQGPGLLVVDEHGFDDVAVEEAVFGGHEFAEVFAAEFVIGPGAAHAFEEFRGDARAFGGFGDDAMPFGPPAVHSS